MRIGVDVMGGDHAPGEILKGAFAALEQLDADDRIALAGDRDLIAEAIAERGIDDPRIEIIGTTEVIEMAAPPVDSVRQRPDSSIVVLARMSGPKEAKLDGWLSAGNTGACVTASQFHMKRLPGVHRPGIAVTVPTFAGPIVLLDVGANIAPKPHHLAQYGVMGRVFSQKVLGVENPRVALMNVGGEEQKGTTEMKRARDLLRSSRDTNFIGYVEGRGVFNGEADVVITDGVVGNVMLKLAEGLSAGIFKAIAAEVMEIDPSLALRLEPVVRSIYAKHDYHEYGGAPLLGVNGYSIIAHGSSVARTITNAILRTRQFAQSGLNDAMVSALAEMEEVPA
ncbi:MAG: phosphate acyltransferase PlsX [Phycisphaerales bacterium]|jgi:glycerol-3-phosphate acyltransferase PlsX